jgi:hypothetical protein
MLHAKRVYSLANATLGVMTSASLAVSTIGHGLAFARWSHAWATSRAACAFSPDEKYLYVNGIGGGKTLILSVCIQSFAAHHAPVPI